MKTMKQILAGLLVMAMLITGLMITPMDAKAAETVEGENGVEYILDTTKYNFADYWKANAAERKAPTKDGCVFGGWYRNTDGNGTMKAITQTEAEKIADGTDNAEVWAKFVPAEVLSVRTQLEATTATADGTNVADNGTTYLRLLSGVNGLDYQKVGFDIWYNKKYQEEDQKATNITKVYKTITNDETDDATTDKKDSLAASSVFGAAATHFSVLRLNEIYKGNFNYVIYVTPQWTTLDGTLVEGQAKYVRVIDGYASNRYISIPVNFLEGNQVVAGQLKMTYDKDKLEIVDFDAGTLMPEMAYKNDANGTIQIVGNIANAPAENTVGVEPESEIYANVWFKVKDGVTINNETELQFNVSEYSFCNWNEQMVNDISAWNVKYLK